MEFVISDLFVSTFSNLVYLFFTSMKENLWTHDIFDLTGACASPLGLGWDYKLPDSAFSASSEMSPGEYSTSLTTTIKKIYQWYISRSNERNLRKAQKNTSKERL